MRRLRPTNWIYLALIVAVFAVLLVHAVLIPYLNEYILGNSQVGRVTSSTSPYSGYSFYEQVVRRFGTFITCGWFFVFGASIGSFINVVVWRMPQGKSTLFKPSFCPRCHAKIRLTDNIPVLGWFRLGGRCRSCGLPISFRYPFVEFIFGSTFLILFLLEFLSGAANIPGSAEYRQTGVVYLVWFLKPELLHMYLFHSGLLTFLLAVGLMRFDGSQIPWRFTLLVLAAALVAAVSNPYLQTVRFHGVMEMYQRLPDDTYAFPDWPDRILTPGIGLCIGGLLGALIGYVLYRWTHTSSVQRSRTWLALSVMGSGIGLFLGWQAAISIFAIQGLLLLVVLPSVSFLQRKIQKSRFLAEQLFVAALIHLVSWNGLESLRGWPSGPFEISAIAVGVLIATFGYVVFARFGSDVDSEVSNTTDETQPRTEPTMNSS